MQSVENMSFCLSFAIHRYTNATENGNSMRFILIKLKSNFLRLFHSGFCYYLPIYNFIESNCYRCVIERFYGINARSDHHKSFKWDAKYASSECKNRRKCHNRNGFSIRSSHLVGTLRCSGTDRKMKFHRHSSHDDSIVCFV